MKVVMSNERWVPYAVFVSVFFITFILWLSLLAQEKINNKNDFKEKIIVLRKAIEFTLTDHIYHMGNIADQWNGEGSHAKNQWKDLVYSYLNQHKNNQIVAWIDTNNRIKQISPSIEAKSIEDLNIAHWEWQENFQKDIDGKHLISLILPLNLNLKQIAILEPIYWKGKLIGSVFDRLDLKILMDKIIQEVNFLPGFRINLSMNGRNIYSLTPKTIEKDLWFVDERFSCYGSRWEISVGYPNSIFVNIWNMGLHNVILICGFLFSILFSIIVGFSYAYKRKNVELEIVKSSLLKAQKIAKMGSWVWNLKTDKIDCSPETFEILGVRSEQSYLRSAEYFSLIDANESNQFKDFIEKLKEGKPSFPITHTLIRPDKKELIVFLEANASLGADGYPIEIMGIIQDITERKNLEKELQQSQKMETIGQLTGGIAHDFNNLLMVIRGNLELMVEDLTKDLKQVKRINLAIQAIEKGSNLIKRLLTFSRRQTLHVEKIKLQEIIPEFVKLLKPSLGGSIEIIVSLPSEIWPVLIDLSQFENALLNLAVNARDAMKGSGKLFLEFKNVTINDPFITKKEKIEPGSYVSVSVTDTGEGMIPEVLEQVFEPFFTTKDVGKGSGLGLPMVYGFVKQSRGFISIESKVGHGTTIHLYMPKAYLDYKRSIQETTKNENINAHEKILLVEDEEALLEMTREYLEQLGYKIVVARNGTEALKMFKTEKNIDLLLTDVTMPGKLTGPKLAIEARRIRSDLKVLFVTGYPRTALAEQKISTESFEILTKPYSMLVLAKTIRNVLNTNSITTN